ncbi:hypothetical protein Tco_1220393 [Tanacetum coccineum]
MTATCCYLPKMHILNEFNPMRVIIRVDRLPRRVGFIPLGYNQEKGSAAVWVASKEVEKSCHGVPPVRLWVEWVQGSIGHKCVATRVCGGVRGVARRVRRSECVARRGESDCCVRACMRGQMGWEVVDVEVAGVSESWCGGGRAVLALGGFIWGLDVDGRGILCIYDRNGGGRECFVVTIDMGEEAVMRETVRFECGRDYEDGVWWSITDEGWNVDVWVAIGDL